MTCTVPLCRRLLVCKWGDCTPWRVLVSSSFISQAKSAQSGAQLSCKDMGADVWLTAADSAVV